MKKYEYLKTHFKILKPLIKYGDISGRLLTDFEIYKVYLTQVGTRMAKYYATSEEVRISTSTVIRAVLNMEKDIRL